MLQDFLARHNAPFSLQLDRETLQDRSAPPFLLTSTSLPSRPDDPSLSAAPTSPCEMFVQEDNGVSPVDIRFTSIGRTSAPRGPDEFDTGTFLKAAQAYQSQAFADRRDSSIRGPTDDRMIAASMPGEDDMEIERPLPKARRKRTKAKGVKRYLNAKSSNYCHVCCRARGRGDHMICSNVSHGTCRKVICSKCFSNFGWDWHTARSDPESWVCPHCENKCPPRAQCKVYSKSHRERNDSMA